MTVREVKIPTTGTTIQVAVGDQVKFTPSSKGVLLAGQNDVTIRAPNNRTKFTVEITSKNMFKVQVNANNMIGTFAYLTWVADSKADTGKPTDLIHL